MKKSSAKKSLLDAYQFDGFKTSPAAKGKLGDKNARVLSLFHRKKKVFVYSVASGTEVGTIGKSKWSETFHAGIDAFIWNLTSDVFSVERLVW